MVELNNQLILQYDPNIKSNPVDFIAREMTLDPSRCQRRFRPDFNHVDRGGTLREEPGGAGMD